MNIQPFRHLILAIALLVINGVSSAQDNDTEVDYLNQAELEQILAPIALYPDTILSHILVAATYPLEVIQAERWTADNPDLQDAEAVAAVADMGWDPSVQALVAFPQILRRLSLDVEWTQKLGEAFLQDEQQVLASIQSLRQLADEAGNLDDLDKLSVTRDNDYIVIEPIERDIIYVPYYDTRVVYGPWRWSYYAPVYWDYPYRSIYDRRSLFYWGPRVSVSFGFFFNTLHWRDRHIVRIPRHHYRPYRFYNRRQILTHRYAQRWAHNPIHRRGVIYKNRTIRHRFNNRRAFSRIQPERVRSRLYTQRLASIDRRRENIDRRGDNINRRIDDRRRLTAQRYASPNGHAIDRARQQQVKPSQRYQRATSRDTYRRVNRNATASFRSNPKPNVARNQSRNNSAATNYRRPNKYAVSRQQPAQVARPQRQVKPRVQQATPRPQKHSRPAARKSNNNRYKQPSSRSRHAHRRVP